jgi:paraquat-inducible protein A
VTTDSSSTGLRYRLVTCPICSELRRMDRSDDDHALACLQCGEPLRLRHRASLERALACLLAGTILYVPANALPVMHTSSILGEEDDTIMSGVLVLLNTGSWPLALLVFFASIFVPVFKLVTIAMLVVTARRHSAWAPLQRTKLYRIVEFVGRWSMLDVYVITVLVSLVRFQGLATIVPGAGALAFAAVVVLTMLAAQSFDPKLIWDATDHE